MILPVKIHDYIRQQENAYETQEVQIGENWYWNMRRHIQLIFHLKNGIFFSGMNDFLRAFKQIMRPMLRLSYWTEDLEVKDVTFFIENSLGRVKSFLLKKYHDEVYTVEHDLDTMFDEITESDVDYGGVLVQKGLERPEVMQLNSIAFCDQTDILGGPIGFKLNFTPDKLRSMSKFGWGEESNGANISLNDLCLLASSEKNPVGILGKNTNITTGKNIEVYIVRGSLPENYLLDNDNMEDFYNQLQIVAFYTVNGKPQNAILYRKKESEGNLKFHASEKVYGMALGYSDGWALVHPQIWTNWLTIHKNSLLEAASKVPLVTDDPSYTQKNKIQDMENLEITTIGEGKSIRAIETAFVNNVRLYEGSINEMYENAQLNANSFDSIMGKEESAGMTFRGQERLVSQGRGWHDRRRGQRAKFIEKIYQDWIIPDMQKEITKGKKFLASLTVEEMSWVADQLATNAVNKHIKEMILSGKKVSKEEQEVMTQTFKQNFVKTGSKQLLEIIKDEFTDEEVKVRINVAGKAKNLANLSDKLLSTIEVAMTNPQFRANLEANGMTGIFNDLLEYSGLNQVDFNTVASANASLPPMTMQAKPLTLTAANGQEQ